MNEHNIRKLSVMKRALAIAWAFGVLLFVVGPAHAGTLDVLNAFTLGPNTVSDNSGDELINGANGTTAGSTIVQPGSILLATFGMNSITNAAGINGIGTGTGYTQLNGLIAVQCLSETSSNGGFSATFGPATSQADLAAIGSRLSQRRRRDRGLGLGDHGGCIRCRPGHGDELLPQQRNP